MKEVGEGMSVWVHRSEGLAEVYRISEARYHRQESFESESELIAVAVVFELSK